jgi:hypothetical protein
MSDRPSDKESIREVRSRTNILLLLVIFLYLMHGWDAGKPPCHAAYSAEVSE